MPLCSWESAQYLFISSNVPPLFYYSHSISVIFALVFGFLIFFKARKLLSAKLLFVITILFSLWVLLDLYIWATNDPSSVLFFWSIIILVEVLIYIFSIYFIDVFVTKQDVSFKKKLLLSFLTLPIIITLPTYFNLEGIDMSSCVAIEGIIAIYYIYIVEIFSILWILFSSFKLYRKADSLGIKKQVVFSTIGILLFLLALSSGNIIGSFTEQWDYSQIGLFAMPVFIGILAYLVVKYNSFNIKLIATQALVWGLAIFIGSQFFFIKVTTNFILNGVTFVASIVFGYFLIKSVKKEIEQKEELVKLYIDLDGLLKQRESLIHLVTHKVKGSFTRSKYIFDGILGGMFGDINDKVRDIATQGLESDNGGIETVDLVLNAANLTKGTIKYDMKTINFKELVDKSINDKKISIEAKGLKLETEMKPARDASGIVPAGGEDTYNVLGDTIWLKEVVNNLIENAIKYTQAGKITVGLEKKDNPAKDGARKVLFYVKDTGVGVNEEDKKRLFTEGGRGKESVKINVDSTGYGLYSVRLIVDAHKGRVWMEPNKEGSGSIFFVELDAV
ncbi:MAG: sensor histidine kinase [Candidatus Paceibacterota bacterium]